jgi:hypothetical protein
MPFPETFVLTKVANVVKETLCATGPNGPKLNSFLQMGRYCFAILLLFALGSVADARSGADIFPPSSGPLVSGSKATLRFGLASAPTMAPLPVKRAIWAGNQLRYKRYRYGGGHRSFFDKGYDCSGTVSYVLGAAGLLRSPTTSRALRSYGARGEGKWITIYARKGHTYAVIAGLRLDTTEWNEDTPNRHWAPRWRLTSRKSRGYVARHPVGL